MRMIRIACRDNVLAVAQAHAVMQSIRNYDPTVVPELIPIRTTSDEMANHPEPPEGSLGAHAGELAQALRSGSVDLAVHALRDMPYEEDLSLPIVAVGRRDDPLDALVVSRHRADPDYKRPLGVSNECRSIQAARLHPDWTIRSIRGDTATRLAALDAGVYGGVIMPKAVVQTLQEPGRVYQTYTLTQVMPACCQGIVAVQGRAGEYIGYLAGFHDAGTWDCALAEMAFSKAMISLGENVFAAHAAARGGKLTIQGILGDRNMKLWVGGLSGRREDAVSIGAGLAARLKYEATPRKPREKR